MRYTFLSQKLNVVLLPLSFKFFTKYLSLKMSFICHYFPKKKHNDIKTLEFNSFFAYFNPFVGKTLKLK